ncbi:MAG: mechanosensitive ion channel family protein [Rhizobacter sp.]|nr:mechanosensitive ion channel family protein [Chlorobiales bacterium]
MLEKFVASLTSSATAQQLIIAAVIVIVTFVLAWLSRLLTELLSRMFFSKTATTLDDRLAEELAPRLRWLIIIGGLRLALRHVIKALPRNADYADFIGYLDEALYVVLVIVVVRVGLKVFTLILESQLESISSRVHADLKPVLSPLFRKLGTLVAIVLALIVVLDHFSINIGSLIVSLGVGSLAVALAAQDTLANIIAGFIILIDRPFRIGDRVQLPNGTVGDVVQIGLRSTRLINFDNNHVIYSNADLLKSSIINYAYPNVGFRLLIEFSVAYGTDVERVRQLVFELAKKYPAVMDDPKPELQFMKFDESGIDLRLECRVSSYREEFNAKISMREAIHKLLPENGIVFASPQRVIHLAEPVRVQRASESGVPIPKPASSGATSNAASTSAAQDKDEDVGD